MKIDKSKLYKSLKNVGGWLSKTDLDIFINILEFQSKSSFNGSIVEIGSHHGKSLIPLALCNSSKNLYIIDVFENQSLNIDQSGSGDKQILSKNLSKFNIDMNDLVIDARLSNKVKISEILDAVGKSRFFHIDGGHHLEAVLNDIALAVGVIEDFGVIAIDDVFRPEWPEVSYGALSNNEFSNIDFVVFAIGFNKTFWCHKKFRSEYQNILLSDDYLSKIYSKTYKGNKEDILIFQSYPLPEWKLLHLIRWYIMIYHPIFYIWFKKRF